MTDDTLRLILDKNPGLLSILFTGVLLPFGILWLTNLHDRKQKETAKTMEIKYNSKEDLRHQENTIYASLSKVLFDMQQLHLSLSEDSIDHTYISNATRRFDESVSKYHDDISSNMLYLSSPVVNLIYKFYSQINELKIELRKLNSRQDIDLARVSVFYYSQDMADTLIEVQGIFIKERSEFKVQFDKAQQSMMKSWFGPPPSEVMKKKYISAKQEIASANKAP